MYGEHSLLVSNTVVSKTNVCSKTEIYSHSIRMIRNNMTFQVLIYYSSQEVHKEPLIGARIYAEPGGRREGGNIHEIRAILKTSQ